MFDFPNWAKTCAKLSFGCQETKALGLGGVLVKFCYLAKRLITN